jgi:predicted RNase H-like HicB family nuclease
MFQRYLNAALSHAEVEWLADDGLFYGEIPGFDGVYASGETMEECSAELAEVLEGWILLGISMHHDLPEVDGLRLSVSQTQSA